VQLIALWMTAVLAAGLTLLISVAGNRGFRRRLLAGQHPARPPWSVGDVLLVTALAFIGVGVTGMLVIALEKPFGSAWLRQPFVQLLLGVLRLDGVIAAAVLLVVSRHSPRPARSLGLRAARPAWDVLRGATLLGAAIPVWLVFSYTWQVVLQLLGEKTQLQEVVQLLVAPQPLVLLLASGAIALVVAPVLEETVFRGFLMPTLTRMAGPAAGIVLTAALFGMLHGWPSCIPIFGIGLLLGWLYWKTGSLWVSIGCHSAFNLVSLVTVWLAPESVTKGLQALLAAI